MFQADLRAREMCNGVQDDAEHGMRGGTGHLMDAACFSFQRRQEELLIAHRASSVRVYDGVGFRLMTCLEQGYLWHDGQLCDALDKIRVL